jgi:hypothetical protein
LQYCCIAISFYRNIACKNRSCDASQTVRCIFFHFISRIEEILAELQFSFVCFLVGQNYDSFERWKKLLEMILTCDEALTKYPQLYNTLITDMHFQVSDSFCHVFVLSSFFKFGPYDVAGYSVLGPFWQTKLSDSFG